ncbi:MAG: D-glycero-beta-D-manno-heptose-7-phosphate kinase [Rhodospirillales bacterium]|jgi:D-beta-D-heptose 7-phosphate kinase / D-beta-D-heptose 1-phosphate adenosyltransferase|nr:D-glycero-beta-D-manno-heptose-7-phosphate kinase [Rhodospirillales bacterium]
MSEQDKLTSLTESFHKANVLCFGDIMLDRFVYGTVDRISPEAPIPVLSVEREANMVGGAGNVVRNVAALGGSPSLSTVIGDDSAGASIKKLLQDDKVATTNIITAKNRETAIKTRYLSGNHQLLRADRETLTNIDSATIKKIITTAKKAMKSCGSVVISDYGKGVLVPDVIEGIIDAAKASGKPVIIDPKGRDYWRYQGADLVTPNKAELAEAVGHTLHVESDIVDAAKSLVVQYDLGAVLVTRSHEGMTLVTAEGAVTHLPAEAREVFDVTGAGDTVVAAIATTLASGANMVDAATIANICAGIVVGKMGTAACYAADLSASIHHQSLSEAESKVLGLDQLRTRVRHWQSSGKKVGFTNGCFDLLHPGHISLLKQSRKACDCLIVGLNSDSSVRGLKGDDRPVQNEIARATIIASLADVAAVVLFSEDTPIKLIKALKPDVLIKGADYTIEQVVGADVVQGYGGKVVLANLKDGHSTTNTISKMGK